MSRKLEQIVNGETDQKSCNAFPATRAMDIFKGLEEKIGLHVGESPRLSLSGFVARDEVKAGLMAWAALEAYEFISANIESINDKRLLVGFLSKTYDQIVFTKELANILEYDFTHAAQVIHELHEHLSSLSLDDLADLVSTVDLIEGLATFGTGLALSLAVGKIAQRINRRKRKELQNTLALLQRLDRFTILAKRRAPTSALLSEYKALRSQSINFRTGLE